MINLGESIKKYRINGYDEQYAIAKVSQDMILRAIGKSKYKNNITIKGGLVMFNLTKNIRRATIDIDIDLVNLSLGNPNIMKIFKEFSNNDIRFMINEDDIEELRHEDYKGKTVDIEIVDNFNKKIITKVDIGVHGDIDILLDELIFDVGSFKNRLSLLANSKEQIFVEKIIPLLKHGSGTTRYKDLFDVYWLIKKGKLDKERITFIIEKKIYNSGINNIYNYEALIHYLKRILTSKRLKKSLDNNIENWLDVDTDELLITIQKYLEQLVPISV